MNNLAVVDMQSFDNAQPLQTPSLADSASEKYGRAPLRLNVGMRG